MWREWLVRRMQRPIQHHFRVTVVIFSCCIVAPAALFDIFGVCSLYVYTIEIYVL
jgi:hypothetical protein